MTTNFTRDAFYGPTLFKYGSTAQRCRSTRNRDELTELGWKKLGPGQQAPAENLSRHPPGLHLDGD